MSVTSTTLRRAAPGAALVALLAAVALPGSRSEAQDASAAPTPLRGFTTHVVATHYLGRRSYTAEHYFKQIRPGLLQGLVVRRSVAGAPIIEVEWAISADRYRRLPARQRADWHPLGPAVDAGRVRVPGASPADEREALAGIRGLWAQTLNLGGIDAELPTGPDGVRSVTHLAPGEHTAGG